ncbi:hypothetical protein G6011_10329 [Alternaria panax]|uniref:Glycosyltransferase family 34 protein n=1 Tax=Alternaria panax TaxID=48097 RepID=A0AAD4IBN8_9PLEO|nr:hypothetical protein G6011_10329 [Alternaria panax]
MPPLNRSLRRYRDTIRLVFGIVTLILGFSAFLGCTVLDLIFPSASEATHALDLEILKTTIFYGSSKKTHEAHILTFHAFYDEHFSYKTDFLRTPIVRGGLNKLLHLQSLIINELQEPIEQQIEWILYFDPAVILANPHIPLHHFLPPITDVETFKRLSIIATKSGSNYLNTSVFFIRVSGNSLRILNEAMERIYNAPYVEGYENEDNDGGLPSAALQDVLHGEHHRDKTLAMDDEHSQMFPEKADIHRFWHTASEARRVLDEAKEKGHTSEQGIWWEAVKEVKEWVELRAWDIDELGGRVEMLRIGINDD